MPDVRGWPNLSLNTASVPSMSLVDIARMAAAAGFQGLSLWLRDLEEVSPTEAAPILQDHGLKPVSLWGTGYFVASGAMAREQAKTQVRKAIDKAVALGAPILGITCGATPEVDLPMARRQAMDGIHAVEPHARAAEIRLAIEPMHPLFADTGSAINLLEQVNNIITAIDSPWVGACVDTWHTWWDPYLRSEIRRTGAKSLFLFQVADWRVPTRDEDREVPGEGCVPIGEIHGWVRDVGYTGWIDVEVPMRAISEWEPSRFLAWLYRATQNALR
ncbi:MAG TPA: sugar phosphate isomerase/epimerase family protein [Candidatus Hydrogenedentes bacterium]|nr:sugar phosphate isomerase/epimerase family protein [Candidatus Hydrogenedentota bacterium]